MPGVRDNKQVMTAQIKKAARETSKNTIYSANGDVPTNYEGWKARLLCMDYNWQLKRAEGITPGRTQSPKATTPQKGGQMSSTPKKKTATGTTFRGRGMPMDIDATKAAAKCYQCGKISHFKCDCPNALKSREEALHCLQHVLGPTSDRGKGIPLIDRRSKRGH